MCAILTENRTIIEIELQTELVRLSVIKHTATDLRKQAALLLQSGRMLASEALSSSDITTIRNFSDEVTVWLGQSEASFL